MTISDSEDENNQISEAVNEVFNENTLTQTVKQILSRIT